MASLSVARARATQAKAGVELIRAQHQRALKLAGTGNLSEQEVDASSLRLTTGEAEVATTAAEVERLSALVSYLTIKAPFDGTITRRYVDVGALVSGERTALFELVSQGSMRIDVDAPQWAAQAISTGVKAKAMVGDQQLTAVVSRTSGALDPTLRTLRVEMEVDAPPKNVVPGAYTRVTFDTVVNAPPMRVPGSVLALRQGNAFVAEVNEEIVHLVPVTVVRELGREVELQGRLTPQSQLVMYPQPSLQEGDRVRLAAVTPGAPK